MQKTRLIQFFTQHFKVFFVCTILYLGVFNNGVFARPCNSLCTLHECDPGLICSSGRCRNPSCTQDNSCSCAYTIQGTKVGMPGNQSIEPFISQTVTVVGVGSSSNNPYSFPTSFDKTVNVTIPAGSRVGYTRCYNNTACHNDPPISGSSADISAQNAAKTASKYVDLWWHFTPLTPNCEQLNWPSTVYIGDTVSLNTSYVDDAGPVTDVGLVIYNTSIGCYPQNPPAELNQSVTTTQGDRAFNWTPSAVGTYTAYCRAWNDGIAECRGDCVDAAPRYPCKGSDGNGLDAKKTISVTDPGPWFKVKDASFHKVGALNEKVVNNIAAYDADDDATKRFVTFGESGLTTVEGSYNSPADPNPVPANNNSPVWNVENYTMNQPYLGSYFEYVTSKKEFTTISSLVPQQNAINVYTGNPTINSDLPNAPYVLIVNGDVTIDMATFNAAESAVAIIADQITFSPNTTAANGIFIANTIIVDDTVAQTTGLKIKGNLITKTFTNSRTRSDNTKPTIFVVFQPKYYIRLLPTLNISLYDWRQVQ